MKKETQELFHGIIKCGIENASQSNCCGDLLKAQGQLSVSDFHVPEPWNGNIETARIMFLSINPGFTAGELYPRIGNAFWKYDSVNKCFDHETIVDYFEHRFSSKQQYVRHNGMFRRVDVKKENGEYIELPRNGQTFWGYVYDIACREIGEGFDFERDCVITELVHCKTRDVASLPKECYEICFKKWFESIVRCASNVEKIVVIGRPTRVTLEKAIEVEPCGTNIEKYKWYCCRVFGRSVKIIFADHNAGGGTVKNFPENGKPSNSIAVTRSAPSSRSVAVRISDAELNGLTLCVRGECWYPQAITKSYVAYRKRSGPRSAYVLKKRAGVVIPVLRCNIKGGDVDKTCGQMPQEISTDLDIKEFKKEVEAAFSNLYDAYDKELCGRLQS